MGFFTDTSVCIGCKACEVACKEWNAGARGRAGVHRPTPTTTPASLGANTWRHVAFIEQAGRGAMTATRRDAIRWLMSSDVCKHCTHSACLDVCPTGAIFRTEFGTVVVQEDVCNGCGYCVPACPFGVLDRREIEDDGRVWKCTLCYDRIARGHDARVRAGLPDRVDPVRPARRAARARRRTASTELVDDGVRRTRASTARDPADGVGGFGAFFLLLDEPEVYGLPPDPVRHAPATCRRCGGRSARRRWALAGAVALSMLGGAAMTASRPHRPRLLLRPSDPEGTGLEARGRLVPLHRRPGRRLGQPVAGRAADRQPLAWRAPPRWWPPRPSTSARCCWSRTWAGRSGS